MYPSKLYATQAITRKYCALFYGKISLYVSILVALLGVTLCVIVDIVWGILGLMAWCEAIETRSKKQGQPLGLLEAIFSFIGGGLECPVSCVLCPVQRFDVFIEKYSENRGIK